MATDDFWALAPSHESALRAAIRVQQQEAAAENILFLSSVDREQTAECHCTMCPPRSDQAALDYCCSSLFRFPLKNFGTMLREGIEKKIKNGEGGCIAASDFFTKYLLLDAVQ